MTKQTITLLLASFWLFTAGCGEQNRKVVSENVVDLDAAALYSQSYQVERIRFESESGAVVLDPRKIRGGKFRGFVLTDVIDPIDRLDDCIVPDVLPENVTISCETEVPEGTRVNLYVRSGNSYFHSDDWGVWQRAESFVRQSNAPGTRYFQVRVELESDNPDDSPRVKGLKLLASYRVDLENPMESGQRARIKNQRIVRSPVAFGYERPDQAEIAQLVERNRLGELVSDCSSELDTILTINHWVASTRNTRHQMFGEKDYPWDLDKIVSYDSKGRASIEGHCMSYAVVCISALNGLGFHARHWCDEGFRFAGHEVVEVWSNSMGKWIYLDPSLDHYYRDKSTGEPLNILELLRVWADTFLRDGETLRLPMDKQRVRVKQIGGKNVPIEFVHRGYGYGKPLENYNWGWFHGYNAAGFMRLTTRNNFHSVKEPWFPYFGKGVHNYDSFLSWTDEKTPLSDIITLFSDRERDFYWTLDQAAIKARQTRQGVIELEFGHSMPFFRRFLVSSDGGPFHESQAKFIWNTHPGDNTLTVIPENEYGRLGVGSTIKLTSE